MTRTDEAQREAERVISRDALLATGWQLETCGTCGSMVILGHKVWTLACAGVPQCSWTCLAKASMGSSL